ncbi:MAG TPA: AraC family transcriptional regulator [Polyangiaceae bacterium]|jgi:AraC-like DNA-binding protein|nr:AraC family transcriptional regulator [Polyangiaceae bacterium]
MKPTIEPFRSVRYVKTAALGGCELSYVHTITGAAPPDMRASLEVTLVDFGDKTIVHRGVRQRIQSGVVGVRSPFETGKLVQRRAAETRIRVLAIGEAEMLSACEAAGLRPRDLPSVLCYMPNRPLFAATSSIFEAVEVGGSTLEVQTRIASCAAGVVEVLAGVPPRQTSALDPGSARRIRELLHDCTAEDLSLDELARRASLSRTYAVHAFQRAYQLSPFAYLMQLRVARARELLARGWRPTDVAHACGFCDQSHLNRWFHKAVGVTPGVYAASVGPLNRGAGRPRST